MPSVDSQIFVISESDTRVFRRAERRAEDREAPLAFGAMIHDLEGRPVKQPGTLIIRSCPDGDRVLSLSGP